MRREEAGATYQQHGRSNRLGCMRLATDATELSSSQWSVIEVDGEPVPSGEGWLYFEEDTAELVTQFQVGNRNVGRHCRKGEAQVGWGGDGLNFSGFASGEDGRCDAGMAEWHDRIARALAGTERWQASGDTLDLIGSNQVRLRQTEGSE